MRARETRCTRAGVTRVDALALLVMLALLVALAIPSRALCDERADKAKCGNNLGAIAKGAFQYATDWRFYPHLSKPGVLDNGGKASPAGNDVPARCMRAIVWDQLKIDDPEVFVCPAWHDKANALNQAAKADGRCFRWGGSASDPSASPIVKADEKDKDSDKLTDLSYGWTLKQITSNSGSQTLLSGDRARVRENKSKGQTIRGNHEDGWALVTLDSHVRWVKAEGSEAKLIASTERDGFNLVAWDERNYDEAPPADQGSDAEIAEATKAIEANPKSASAWASRGACREKKGDHEGAVTDCTKAIELDPKNANAWRTRSAAREAKGDHEGAASDKKHADELEATKK